MGVGATVTVTGVVTNGEELGTIRYIQDETAGIGIYDWDVTYFQRGDEVTVTGKLSEFNQLLEVGELTAHTVNSSGNPLPEPALILIDEMDESFEGELVRINEVSFVNPVGTFAGNTNYNITAGGETGVVRVNTGSNLVGQVIPTGEVDLVGILGQFHYTDPNAGYQLLLRDVNDILLGEQIAITSTLELSGLTTGGFNVSWKTNLDGSSEAFYGHTPALELGKLSGAGNDTNHTVTVSGASPSTLFYLKAFSVKGPDTAFSATHVYVTKSISSGDIKVYFTSTVDNSVSTGMNAMQVDNAVDDTLINYIGRAKESIDISIYNFGATGVSDISGALNAAYARGVDIRVIVGGSTANQGIDNLNPAIPKLASPTGPEDGIMHNKFVVFDLASDDPEDDIVWTGSTNWTDNNVNLDANNVIIIQDKSLAIAYTLEFQEMWGGSGMTPNQSLAKFGAAKADNTPHEFIIGDIPVYCYFSPSDAVNGKIIETIKTADADIEVNTMLITRSDIGYELADMAQQGVDVKVMVNSDGDCTSTVVNTLTNAIGSKFKEFGEGGLLHSKCMIVDQSDPGADPLVLAGSHNWSNSANDVNDENTLIIHDAAIANLFYQEFVERYNKGVSLDVEEWKVNPGRLEIYPNPSTGSVSLLAPESFRGRTVITVIDLSGRSVLNEVMDLAPGTPVLLDLQQVPEGLYILRLERNGSTAQSKVLLFD